MNKLNKHIKLSVSISLAFVAVTVVITSLAYRSDLYTDYKDQLSGNFTNQNIYQHLLRSLR